VKPCDRCGRLIDENHPTTRHHVEGWVQRRKRGIHGVELAEYDGRVLCPLCVSELKAGFRDQLSFA
jgi:hypothetical protein